MNLGKIIEDAESIVVAKVWPDGIAEVINIDVDTYEEGDVCGIIAATNGSIIRVPVSGYEMDDGDIDSYISTDTVTNVEVHVTIITTY